jgi:sugar-specific transcriptional regulator TrmB
MNSDRITVQKILGELGYSGNVAETYWALLNLESVSIRKIAELSGINRGTTYEALKILMSAGLVTTRKSGEREYYSAESPEKIFDLIRDRRKELWHVQEDAKKVIPEVLARTARPAGRPIVKYYEDDDGVVMILRDVLQTCGQMSNPLYCAYSTRPIRKYLYRKFSDFTKRRIAEGIEVQVIAIGQGGESDELSKRKWLDSKSANDISSYTIIYGNKVAQISISDDFTPYGVVIEDAGVASLQRLMFDKLWSVL